MYKPKFRISNAEFGFYLLKYLRIITNLIIIIIKVNIMISIVIIMIKNLIIMIRIIIIISKYIIKIISIVIIIIKNIIIMISTNDISEFSTKKKTMPFFKYSNKC